MLKTPSVSRMHADEHPDQCPDVTRDHPDAPACWTCWCYNIRKTPCLQRAPRTAVQLPCRN